MLPKQTIAAFDTFLAERELHLEAVVVGGSALALLGVTERETRDVDILHPELPGEIAHAARAFAEVTRRSGLELDDNWLNNGPSQLTRDLPEGWRVRVQVAFEGEALLLTTLGRTDLLKTKLFALCDRGTDLTDCLAISPTAEEIDEAERWVAQQDAHPQWPDHVRATLDDLRRRLGDGV